MKTKDFIKMLQEADPSGETHIRLEGGVPIFAERVPGYYDGSYTYMEDGKFIYSSEDCKVDIHTKSGADFICDQITFENCFDENLWETLSSKLEFHFTYTILQQREDKINRILESIKVEFDEDVLSQRKIITQRVEEAEENYNKGWTYFELNKTYPISGFNVTWVIYDENGKKVENSLVHIYHFTHTDKYYKIDNGVKNGYDQWVKK